MAQRNISVLFCISLFLAIGCSDDDKAISPKIFTVDTIQVGFNQSAAIHNTSYTIRFDSMRFDARRPLKDQDYTAYIWEWDNGWAEAQFHVIGINGKLRLPIDAAPPDSVGETNPGQPVRVAGLKFRLIALSPLRTETDQVIPDSEYVATVVIEIDSNLQATPSRYYPLWTGNNWSYRDTNWYDGNIVRTQDYDIEVLDPFHDVLGSWWRLSRGSEFLSTIDGSIMMSGDSVCMRQSGYFFRQYGGIFSYPMTFFKEPGEGIDTIMAIFEGDILYSRYARRIEDTSIVLAMGVYTTVYEYSGQWGYHSDCKIYIAPGVGVIRVVGSGGPYRYEAVLTNYDVQEQ